MTGLFWWFTEGQVGRNGGPHLDEASAERSARFWCSREGAASPDYLIVGTAGQYRRSGSVADGEPVPDTAVPPPHKPNGVDGA